MAGTHSRERKENKGVIKGSNGKERRKGTRENGNGKCISLNFGAGL